MKYCLITFLGIGLTACASAAPGDLEAFPAAEDGMQRHVIRLPALEDEDAARVELIAGRDLEVDCNQHWYSASLSEQNISGWGYSYYVIEQMGGPASTLKACPGEPRERRFVSARLGESLLRYNSRLPLVVYIPEGFELRYRVWSASDEIRAASSE